LFAGFDDVGDNWVAIATRIENYKLIGMNPHTWLTATPSSPANDHPVVRIDEPLPHVHVV
jgi:uncharacterized protein (DUF2237 family)